MCILGNVRHLRFSTRKVISISTIISKEDILKSNFTYIMSCLTGGFIYPKQVQDSKDFKMD